MRTGAPDTNAGTYNPVTATVNDPNYTGSASGSFVINQAYATVTATAASKTYGTADPALTGTLTGFVAADGVTATYSRVAGETVGGGPYTISAVLAPAAVLGNYEITYNTAAFTINKAVASVTLEQLDKIVGPPARNMTGYEWLWSYFTHTAHHRGQLEVYLRLKGIKPPDYDF